jgi:hypothetical protein
MNSRTFKVLSVAVAVLAVFALGGCQMAAEKATEKAIEGATGVKVDKSGDEVTIEGKDGTKVTTSESGEAPAGFPSDVPIYPGKITASVVANNNYTIGIETSDDVAKVLGFYSAAADKDGWSKVADTKVPDGGVVSAKKGERIWQVAVGKSGKTAGGTQITLSASPEAK